MNIVKAKEEVKRTIEIYMETDEYGEYRIPFMKQRPIFLLGAPGIGKTAIIEQIAEEMNISFETVRTQKYRGLNTLRKQMNSDMLLLLLLMIR